VLNFEEQTQAPSMLFLAQAQLLHSHVFNCVLGLMQYICAPFSLKELLSRILATKFCRKGENLPTATINNFKVGTYVLALLKIWEVGNPPPYTKL